MPLTPRRSPRRSPPPVVTTANTSLTTLTGATRQPRRAAVRREIPPPAALLLAPVAIQLTPVDGPEGSPAGPHQVPSDQPVNVIATTRAIDPNSSRATGANRPASRANAAATASAAGTNPGLAGANAEGAERLPPEDFDVTLGAVLSEHGGERMDVSMTVGRKGVDIYTFWMLRLFILLSWITVKAAIGEEVGPNGGHSLASTSSFW